MILLIQEWPRLQKLVNSFSEGETVKKAKYFSNEELNRFLGLDDTNNAYLLVRKAVGIVAIAGGVRGGDLRKLNQGKLKLITHGYRVTFPPEKQRGHVKEVR